MVEVDTLARKFLLGRMQEWQASSAPLSSPGRRDRRKSFVVTHDSTTVYINKAVPTACRNRTGWHINCGHKISDGGTGQTAFFAAWLGFYRQTGDPWTRNRYNARAAVSYS
jgi:hypothetical protein